MNNRNKIIKKLIYRSVHRGCKENDLIFTAFINQYRSSLSYQELLDLQCILDNNDHDIYDWITNKSDHPEYINKKLIYMLKRCTVMILDN